MADGHPVLEGVWDASWATGLEAIPQVDALSVDAAAAQAIAATNRKRADSIGIPVDPDSDLFFADLPLAPLGGVFRTRMIVEPQDGRLPYTSAAAARSADWVRRQAELQSGANADGPEARSLMERCLLGNGHPPLITPEGKGLRQIVQTANDVVIYSEAGGEVRIIRIDGRPHPDALRSRLGDSLAHWDGDTLVIETTHFPDGGFVIDRIFFPPLQIGRDSRVLERFTRISDHELLYEFTIEDPAIYARPWRAEYPMIQSDHHPMEYACHEGNYSLANILKGAREAERRSAR
jgi:hypothetical protein